MQQYRLQRLFDELSAALVLYARQWCDTPDDAVQEAFIDLANSTTDPETPKAWLYAVTRRKAQNMTRAEHRRRRHHRLAGEQQPAAEESLNWFAATTNSTDLPPEDVVRGVEALPDDDRELVVARVWGELSFEQLAELLGCSVSSAYRRYHAALKRLKGMLSAHADNAEQMSSSSNLDRGLSPTSRSTNDATCCETASGEESNRPAKLE